MTVIALKALSTISFSFSFRHVFPAEKALAGLAEVSIFQVADREAGEVGGDHGWEAFDFYLGFALRGRVWGASGEFALGFSRVDLLKEIGADAVRDWR